MNWSLIQTSSAVRYLMTMAQSRLEIEVRRPGEPRGFLADLVDFAFGARTDTLDHLIAPGEPVAGGKSERFFGVCHWSNLFSQNFWNDPNLHTNKPKNSRSNGPISISKS
jgi:hypothetical protein